MLFNVFFPHHFNKNTQQQFTFDHTIEHTIPFVHFLDWLHLHLLHIFIATYNKKITKHNTKALSVIIYFKHSFGTLSQRIKYSLSLFILLKLLKIQPLTVNGLIIYSNKNLPAEVYCALHRQSWTAKHPVYELYGMVLRELSWMRFFFFTYLLRRGSRILNEAVQTD